MISTRLSRNPAIGVGHSLQLGHREAEEGLLVGISVSHHWVSLGRSCFLPPSPRAPSTGRPTPARIVPANPALILSIHGHAGPSANVSP